MTRVPRDTYDVATAEVVAVKPAAMVTIWRSQR